MATDPMFGPNALVEAMRASRGNIERIRENSARLATSFNTVDTEGPGQTHIQEVQRFDCTFLHRPWVSYGYSMAEDADLDPTALPSATGGVFKWQKDSHGYYIGAWVFVTVQGGAYDMVHDFVFTGVAMKAIPRDLLPTTIS